MNDKIADMLVRIKNAGYAGKDTALVPYSKYKMAIAQVLLKNGYVQSVSEKRKGKKASGRMIEVGIAYAGKNTPKVKGVERVSKLSRRVYMGHRDIKPVRNGFGMLVLSTPKGILTGDEAKKEHVGGEVLFKIW